MPAALARGRGRRRPVAARQGLRHLPADGPGLRHRRRDPRPAGARACDRGSSPGGGPAAGTTIPMQDGSTADMIWSIAELIEFISRSITLVPGDLIATGTPSGVGVFRDPPVFLEPGDRVRVEVEGIGSVENPVIDWTDDRPTRTTTATDDRPTRPIGDRDAEEATTMLALVKTAGRPGPRPARRPDARDRHQRRPDPGPQDGHLRDGPAHRIVGRVGRQDDPAAARRRPRVRRRDRRRRQQRHRLPPGRPRQRRGPRRLRPLPALPGRATPPVRQHDRPRASGGTAPSPSTSPCR